MCTKQFWNRISLQPISHIILYVLYGVHTYIPTYVIDKLCGCEFWFYIDSNRACWCFIVNQVWKEVFFLLKFTIDKTRIIFCNNQFKCKKSKFIKPKYSKCLTVAAPIQQAQSPLNPCSKQCWFHHNFLRTIWLIRFSFHLVLLSSPTAHLVLSPHSGTS